MNKVLLIDDDVDLLDVLASALAYFGFEVKTSSYTDDIHALVTIHQPDLVIIDYIMNGINGGEMCSMLKKKDSTKKIPVIILSAYDKVINSLGDYGCDAFVSKPFDMQYLINKIKAVIARSKAITP